MRCTRVWEVGDRSALHASRPVSARPLVPGDIVPRLVPDTGARSVYGVLPTGSEMNALRVCPWCWGAHAESAYSATEAAAARKARKARKAAWTGRDSGSGLPPVLPARSSAGLQSEMRNAGNADPELFGISRRRRGPKPGQSRQARWRRRHPEEAARNLARLRARSAPKAAPPAARPGVLPAAAPPSLTPLGAPG